MKKWEDMFHQLEYIFPRLSFLESGKSYLELGCG
jgi:hypothetical protein